MKAAKRIPFDELAANLSAVFDRIIRENEIIVVEKEGSGAVMLEPIPSATARRQRRRKTAADYEAFLASAGGWNGLIDTEKLKEDIAESRRISSRPPVEL